MSENYHSFLSSVSGVGSNPELYPTISAAPVSSPTTFGMSTTAGSNSLQNNTYYQGLTEQIIQYQPSKSQRSRRKAVPGTDHIKHRRTRSGCFTCRGRRVKCDETRPICERCRKGKRECQYPEPSASSKSVLSQGSKDADTSQRSPGSSNDDEDDLEQDAKLSPIPDEDEGESQTPSHQPSRSLRRISTASSLNLRRLSSRSRQPSDTFLQDRAKSSSPTVSSGTAASFTPTTSSLPDLFGNIAPDWTYLPVEFQICLDYFYENITHYHYGVHKDFTDFFHTTFLKLALRNEPLLHAVVGFAAYQKTLKDANGKIQDFLKFYTHAVTLLLELLKKEERHDLGTLLTILQLATIEEYFGDWVNLMGHQKAAFEIINQLFTPQTIMQTPTGRIILAWYLRFDQFVAFMGTFEPSLPRAWIEALDIQCRAQLSSEPNHPNWLPEATENWLRLISYDMCLLSAQRRRGKISEETFQAEHRKLSFRLREWRDNLDPTLTNSSCLVEVPKTDHQLFHYFEDGLPLYEEPWSFTTVFITEWHSIVLTHLCRVSDDVLTEASGILGNRAENSEAICEILEGAEKWHGIPKGMLAMLHPTISMSALWLTMNPQRHIWIKEKFAWLESSGYIFPMAMRVRMAQILEDETAIRWWLPGDRGFSPILQNVRDFADERNRSASSMQPEHVREMSDLFDAVVHLRSQEEPGLADTTAST